MNACGDSRLRGLRSRKPIGFRQWVVHGVKLSPPKVNIKTNKLLRNFILNGEFDTEVVVEM